MLFRKKIEKSCAYCAHGAKLDEEQVLCVKKGVVPLCGCCRRFAYDPCKRIPPKPKAPDFEKYEKEDFSL
ncbi:MAG: hypothetical protein PUB93_00235 [Firmicutes bacterium]|nr:hypothetical protein [Bacillota bacterium]